MTIDEIIAFIEIVKKGSISSASKSLFMTQSTISNRLNLLEKELGVQLIVRQKGIREIILTPYGEKLLPEAIQLLAQWNSTLRLKKTTTRKIFRVGAIDIINTFTFSGFYEEFIKNHGDILLSLNTHHSSEIYGLLENNNLDIGFVYSQIHSSKVKTTPLFKEEMFLISNIDNTYYDGISPNELPEEEEVYLKWSSDYEIWHDYYWSGTDKYLLKVNTASILASHLQRRNRWAIVPHAAVVSINKVIPIVAYKLNSPPPDRICYLLTKNDQSKQLQKVLEIFLQDLYEYLEKLRFVDLYNR